MRYLITLWPPLALLAGAGLRHLAGSQRRMAAGLLAFWLLLGAWLGLATEYRYELGFFQQTYLHLAYRAAGEHIPVTDALVVDPRGGWTQLAGILCPDAQAAQHNL